MATMLLLWLTGTAAAQDFTLGAVPTGLNGQLFRPALDAERTLWTNDSLMAPDNYVLARAMLSYVNAPVIYVRGDGVETELISDLFQADLMGAWYRGRLRLGLDVPVYLRSAGAATGGETGLGDVSLDMRLTGLDRRVAPVGLALAVRGLLPTATVAAPLGYGGFAWELEAIADKELGRRGLLAANLGTRGLPAVSLENVEWNDQLYARLGAGYALDDATGLSLDLNANMTYGELDNPAARPLEALLGGYRQLSDWRLRAGIGSGLNGGIGAPRFRTVLALAYEPPRGDTDPDLDGIFGAADACPDVPEDRDSVADTDGCPEPTIVTVRVVDPDGQLIPGAGWLLGDLSGTGEGRAELYGGTYSLTAEAAGYLPAGGDVLIVDQEAQEAVIRLEPAVTTGTLQVIAVGPDRKPVDGATWTVARSEGGPQPTGEVPLSLATGEYALRITAPGFRPLTQTAAVVRDELTTVRVVLEPSAAELTGERIDIRDSVYFETNRDIIKAQSHPLLDDVAAILAAHPELKKIRIEGHTDSRGSDSYNLDLSQRRAEAVRAYLVAKGISADRLEAIGYGETKPIDPRETAEAWEKNRRVDFFVAERSD